MSVTQDTIAQRLGISRNSVARALNGYGKVSAENRRRIQEAALELGYDAHTNRSAREMVARRYGHKLKTDVIAVLLPKPKGVPLRSETFFLPILDGIEMQAEMQGLDVFLHSLRHDQLPRLVNSGGVDGLICLSATYEVIDQFRTLRLPVVTLSTFVDGAHGVAPDDREGMRLVTQHLIDCGHREIAYLGLGPDGSAGIRRIEGFRAAIESNGLPVDATAVEATLSNLGSAAEGIDRLLERNAKITAVVCYNDTLAMGAIRELERRGIRVPDDIAVTGFDDISVAGHFRPAITSVAFDREAMGRRAVEILSEAGHATGLRHEILPVELIVRDSTTRFGANRAPNLP